MSEVSQDDGIPEMVDNPLRQQVLRFLTHSDIENITNPMIPDDECISQQINSVVASSNLQPLHFTRLSSSQNVNVINPMMQSDVTYTLSQDDNRAEHIGNEVVSENRTVEDNQSEGAPPNFYDNMFEKKPEQESYFELKLAKESLEQQLGQEVEEKELLIIQQLELDKKNLEQQLGKVVEDKEQCLLIQQLELDKKNLEQQLGQEVEEKELLIIQQLELDKKNLRQKLDEVNEEQQYQEDLAEGNAQLKSENLKFRQEILLKQNQLEQTQLQVQQLEKDMQYMKEQSKTQEQNLQIQLAKKDAEINKLLKNSHDGHNHIMKTEIKQEALSPLTYSPMITKRTNSIESINDKLKGNQELINNLKSQLQESQQHLQTVNKQLQESQSQIDTMSQQLKESQLTNSGLRSQHTKLQESILSLESKLQRSIVKTPAKSELPFEEQQYTLKKVVSKVELKQVRGGAFPERITQYTTTSPHKGKVARQNSTQNHKLELN